MIFDIEQRQESLTGGELVEGSEQREGTTGSGSHDLHKAWIAPDERRDTHFPKTIGKEESNEEWQNLSCRNC